MAFHHALFYPLVLDQLVLGVWTLLLGFRLRPVGNALLSALIVDEGLIVLQSILGALVLAGGAALQWKHFLYGGLLLGLLPVVYGYSSRRSRAGVWLGLTLLFMAGLMSRACATGRA